MFCPCDDELCFDESCRAAGCRISGAAPLDACADCGQLVALARRALICDACMAGYAAIPTHTAAITSKG